VSPFIAGPTKREKEDHVPTQSLQEFLHGLGRTVLLGQPGGGKSTLALKICHELATKYTSRPVAGRLLTPVLVILRDYAVSKTTQSGSLLDFIEASARAHYTFGVPPEGAFEYLLTNGSLLVIFDGLDELLETSRRQEVSDDVEAFSTRFPSTPILVTSREVGYDQAPLDEERFAQYRLAPFVESQVSDYARKWFAADPDLLEAQKTERAESFIRDSSLVSDLRSNPLMLSLMCSIYRGENYIPRNRPDVCEKCTLMLFEQWDRSRAIDVSLAIEYHLFPAMQFLAHWIYSTPSLQGGVTEEQLVRKAADYLVPRRFDDREEADAAAREFIEFCHGRAWVFTDTGTTPSGDDLYQFTHRTFLEYFTAKWLVHDADDVSSLLNELRPHILKEEWDVVAQLAYQIMAKSRERAGDELLISLMENVARMRRSQRSNVLSFCGRALEFMVPSPSVTREITRSLWEETLKWLARRPGAGSSRHLSLYEGSDRRCLSCDA
jgi:predicted NACHT family NTPase